MVYKWYILPIGWLYATYCYLLYHLLPEPGNFIDVLHLFLFVSLGCFTLNMSTQVLNPINISIPLASIYGIFTYIYQKNPPNVGTYTIVPWVVWEYHVLLKQEFMLRCFTFWKANNLKIPGPAGYTSSGSGQGGGAAQKKVDGLMTIMA